MGLARLLRRRLTTHPVAVVAIITSVTMSLLVVTALRLLSADIADAGVRSALDVPPPDRSYSVTASLGPGELETADAAVRTALATGGAPVTRVGTPTSRGIEGRAAGDRAVLADVDGLAGAAELTSGRWPSRPTGAAARPGGGDVEVALPEAAARALGVGIGGRFRLVDLVRDDAPRQDVVVTGLFRPRVPSAPVWEDLPLARAGVAEGDFTAYGPFVLAPGTLDTPLFGASTVVWRTVPPLADLTAEDLPAARDLAAETTRALGRLDLRSVRVEAPVPGLLDAAALVAERIRVALLTPTVLLAVLGTVGLVVAAALLAGLRDGETRLLRTRGASSVQLGLLALGESVLVAVVGLVVTALAAPALARAVAGPLAQASAADDGRVWTTALPLAVVAVLASVGTVLWVGRTPGVGTAGPRARALRVAVGSGVDVALVALGALAAVQLRRYDAAATRGVDPLTTAAPVLVIAGLAVLSLRIVPVIARAGARLAVSRPGFDLAWGAWQFSRRATSQAGTLLLVLLAVAMGTVALGHSATAVRAVADQSAFDSGADVRVVGGVAGGAGAHLETLTAQAVGGVDRVMPVWRTTVDVGGVDGVTVLAVDAAAAGVLTPRPDTVAGGSWEADVARLLSARDLGGGIAVPAGTRRLTVDARVASDVDLSRLRFAASLLLRDARGIVSALPLGEVSTRSTDLTVDLGAAALREPVTVVGVSAPLPSWVQRIDAGPTLGLRVDAVAADGRALGGLATFTDHSTPLGLWWAAAPGRVDAVPAVVTRDVADAVEAAGGTSVVLPLGPRDVPVTVVGVLDVLPTASTPSRGILLDLPTLAAVPEQGVRTRAVVTPGEWWAAADDPSAAVTALRGEVPYGTSVISRAEIEQRRLDNPVNAGMRAAMLLVTLAAVLLAAVGFAATTAALGRTRRHENAVLLALGTPPRRIRTVLLLERVLVVVVTVGVGALLGVLAALVVVPLLVGGDGHPQVPSVLVVLPAGGLVLLAVAVTTVLSLVGVLVLRSTSRDLAGELREGEAP